MIPFYSFLGALALSVFLFEIASAIQYSFSVFGKRNRLSGAYPVASLPDLPPRRSTWEVLLVNLLPGRFDPARAKNAADVISMLRRAGWPYETPGDFYAASMHTFSIYLGLGALAAGAVAASSDMAAMAPVIGAGFVYLGLRRPSAQMQLKVKQRAEAMRNNMLIGLSVLRSLLDSGVGVQDALRRTSAIGGPFCNLLGLLVAQIDKKDFSCAIEVVRAHVPDPNDVEVGMFFRDVEAFFAKNRPLASSVGALQEAVHRLVVENTEARASLVQRRASLFGFMSDIGLILGILLPFSGREFF